MHKQALHHRPDHLTQTGAPFKGVSETARAYRGIDVTQTAGNVGEVDAEVAVAAAQRPRLPFRGRTTTQDAYASGQAGRINPQIGAPIQKLHGRPTVDVSLRFRGVTATQAAHSPRALAAPPTSSDGGASGAVGSAAGQSPAEPPLRPGYPFQGRSTTQEALAAVAAAAAASDDSTGAMLRGVSEPSLHHEADHLTDPNASFHAVSSYQAQYRVHKASAYAGEPAPVVAPVAIQRPFRGVSTTHAAQQMAQLMAETRPLPNAWV
ncbi:uncharacterized protein AMSG_01326 [Thecamonas trahens ATCC 50062]|uniref:Uncharacterized protein n=1 Tax=Thecamonas trahens ATCC 50062 TaxID=461836 RepID=A0A0L0DNP4_THETB|nr:hypothetical protein AMSG_01326 [Thecamonas trahens ATCC 50062]KNC53616.1 hypothetical protein AMSG_01326 [Thecamonas trahens ATCC 50062]|eukprot:XP_013761933.1 hypothetical protein AMSG_01326 [Thecamonas trahens ATCC 50062]